MMLLHTMKWRKSLLIIQISNYLVKNVQYKSKLAQKNQEARVAQGIFTYLSCSQRKIIKRLMVFLSSDYLKITCYLHSFFLNSCPNQFWKILDKGKREVFNFYQFLREEWKHRRNIERMFHCHRRWVEEQHNRWLFSSVWLSTSIIESGSVRSRILVMAHLRKNFWRLSMEAYRLIEHENTVRGFIAWQSKRFLTKNVPSM